MAGRWTEGGEKRCVDWKNQTSEKERARLTPKVPDEEALLPLFIVPKWVRGAGKQEVSLVHTPVCSHRPFAAGGDWSVRAVAIKGRIPESRHSQMFVVCSGVLGDRSKTCVLCFDSIRNRSAAADAAVRSLGGTYLEMSTCSSHQ